MKNPLDLLGPSISFLGVMAKDYGLPVTPYTPPPIEWKRPIWLILTLPVLYLSVLNALRGVLHISETHRDRKNIGWAMIIFIVGFPFLWGSQSSGSKVVDFALAVIAFVLSLRLYRIAFMRPVAQTSRWSAIEYYGRLFTFPTESEAETSSTRDFGTSAVWENGKDLGMASVKILVSLFFIRFIPPPEAFDDMSWVQQRVYYAVLGAILLVCLEGFVGGLFAGYGLVFDRHMRHMFNHPLVSCGFRDLWGQRWNLPVTDVLKDVIFKGMTFPLSQWYHESHKTAAHSTERSKRSFRENATAAFATFLVSGAFHEIMSYMAFGDFRWANVKYFSWNAIGCSLEVWMEHGMFPDYARIKRQWWFRFLFVVLWAYGSESYTDGYLKFGFFEEAKVWIGILFPPFTVKEVIWVPFVGKPVRGNW
ncbi:protein of unknown function [Taphrina deformans PYCC 5710]|uniref:Wax synthase domain-containing protein n=1 Tax=Taphrina deformans (strain PYCC 5710 / ATCC 11124 / CBS 356.35 / IMI 108563 / JCM 9778 / NBRC 8474) TaxID=1097556 RepID=R4XJ19_TAPDE|nr:protein of unknown function [Taphrina deformans PYCC 5710]|eukprot:CCG83370.1 protein of unknown function [Taphrina deformans PYCC 5710]